MRQHRYLQIADVLRRTIEDGDVPSGGLLPSEADLCERHGASRVTVRRALEVLRDEGLVAARQGVGWFVAAEPVRQSLGRLGTIEDQLAAEGVRSARKVLDYRVVATPPPARGALGVARALMVRRVNLADDQPFALVTVWCPEALAGALDRDAVERSPFYELIGVPLGGATQTIAAGVATAGEAPHLAVPVGSPVLRCARTTRSSDGTPVLVSEHVFPAHRTEFVVDLPHVAASMAPSGLRLVEAHE